MASGATSASLRNLFSELEQLFQTETQARVSTSVQAAERALTEQFNQAVRRLRQASGFAEIATILCDASARFAGASAVFEAQGSVLTGVRARGAEGCAVDEAKLKELHFDSAAAPAFTGVMHSAEPLVVLGSPTEVSSAVAEWFGYADGDKAYLFPVTADRKTAGVLYATGTVDSAARELFTQVASASLEARRPPVRQESAATEAGLVTIAPLPASQPSNTTAWDSLNPAERKLHLRAQRFARVQVAEIRLYRSEAVASGRARGDLYSALRDIIDPARETFRRDFLSANPSLPDYFHLELLRTLAHDNPGSLGANYPGPLTANEAA